MDKDDVSSQSALKAKQLTIQIIETFLSVEVSITSDLKSGRQTNKMQTFYFDPHEHEIIQTLSQRLPNKLLQ